MLDNTNIDMDPTNESMVTAENIIKDLVEVYGGERKASEKAAKTAEEARQARENSLQALADKLHGINAELDKDMVTSIATSVAEKVFKGSDANTIKTRKSEIKTLLEGRANIKPLYEAFSKYRDLVQKTDPKYSPNLRTQVLGGLRKMRKNEKLGPRDIVSEVHSNRTKEISASESAKKLLEKLGDQPAFKGVTAAGREFLDKRAVAAIEMLQRVIEEGPREMSDREMAKVDAALEGTVTGIIGEDLEESLNELIGVAPEVDPTASVDDFDQSETEDEDTPDLSGMDLDLDELIAS